MPSTNKHSNEIKSDQPQELQQFVTMTIGHQIFGISVEYVVDILSPQKINPIPLTRKEIVGSLNLRGRIVTAIDIRVFLDIHEEVDIQKNMCVVIEYNNELFSLLVDKVGDVASSPTEALIKNPDNLTKLWQEISLGIFPMQNELVVILDLNKVMTSLMGEK